MDVLLDTNLLVRCIQPSHPLHFAATAAMKELSARKGRLCIVPQVLYEYFVICTRPPGQYGGLGMTNEAAVAELSRLLSLFELLPDSAAIFPEWLRLVAETKAVGKRGHDIRLVAAMNIYGIRSIATFNIRDFTGLRNLEILDPAALAAAWAVRPTATNG
jgi:predicted nucleic acid-binding protein